MGSNFNYALAYYDLGQYEKVAKRYEEAVAKHPNKPKPYFLLAKTLTRMKQYDWDVANIKMSMRLDPEADKTFVTIRDIFIEQGTC